MERPFNHSRDEYQAKILFRTMAIMKTLITATEIDSTYITTVQNKRFSNTGMLLIFSIRVKRKLNKGESELQKPQLFLFGQSDKYETPCLEFILTKFSEKLVNGHRFF